MPVYLHGLLLGLSLIMALGPQNVFLIRQGARRQHAALSAIVCFCCDIILVSASVAGLNHLLELHPVLLNWITGFGVLFLLYYGTKALKSALFPNQVQTSNVQHPTRSEIFVLALGFSLLNPHAIIDSLVIIGGGSAQFPGHEYAFLSGVLTASLLWFSSLTITTQYFADILVRAKVWRGIETASGILMLYLSYKLAMHLS